MYLRQVHAPASGPIRLPYVINFGEGGGRLLLGGGWHLGRDAGDHVRVEQRGRVTERAVVGDVAQQPAHDLARPRLGQVGTDQDVARLRDRADLLGDVRTQFGCERRTTGFAVGHVALHRDERDDRLAGDRVVRADDSCLGNLRVTDECMLDLGRRYAVTGDVHDVVDATEQPEVAVLVLLRTVAGEVDTGEP